MIIKHVNTAHCITYEVGQNGVVKIEEHRARGEGDRWYYDVYYKSGRVLRLFNIDEVCFFDGER
jgi:hypothetical protein